MKKSSCWQTPSGRGAALGGKFFKSKHTTSNQQQQLLCPLPSKDRHMQTATLKERGVTLLDGSLVFSLSPKRFCTGATPLSHPLRHYQVGRGGLVSASRIFRDREAVDPWCLGFPG
jgi:hypothetical protein